MQLETLPMVYARALLEAAADRGNLPEAAEEVEAFRVLLEREPEMRRFFESPRVERSKKREVLERALRGKVSDIFTNFSLLLVDKGRERFLLDILAAFQKLYDERIGLVRAEATSAVPLGDEAMLELKSRMESALSRKVAIKNRVDPEILGGLVVRFDGLVADGSVKSALEEIRSRMLSVKFGSQLVHED